MGTAPLSFVIHPFQIQQYRDSLDALESRFTNYYAGAVSGRLRLISRTRRFRFSPIRQELRKQIGLLDDVRELLPLLEQALAGADDAGRSLRTLLEQRIAPLQWATANLRDAAVVHAALNAVAAGSPAEDDLLTVLDACQRAVWRWRWYKNYQRIYDVVEAHDPPLAIDHYLLCWPEEYANPHAIREALRSTFLLPAVDPAPLPNLFAGEYREESDYLAPKEPGRPYLTVLTAYDVRGSWDLFSLAPLLLSDYELALAIDIETLPRARAQRKTTEAFTVLREAVYGKHAVKDPRAERALAAADYTLSQLDRENLHAVAYAILVQAPTLPSLEKQAQTIRDLMGARLRLDRVRGAQADYLTLFTPKSAHTITRPLVRRNTLSSGVAVRVPWGIRKTSRTSGALWGYDIHEAMPIHYDIWGAQGFENAHLMMVGKSGSGKTVSLLTLALRQAVQGNQVIFFDPVGKAQWLCEAVGGGAAYYDVATDAAINILDPLSADLGRQLDHVDRKLSIILGRTLNEGGRITFTPRPLSNLEKGALDKALQTNRIYGPAGASLEGLRAADAPLLEDLVVALREVAEDLDLPEGCELAREIELVLLGARANIFNRPTQLHWDFQSDVVGYNLKEADPALLPLYYDQAFAALNRWVRSAERRTRRQPLITVIDEFFYLASVKALESYVALATKTWRNYQAAMWTADQNATTYFGQAGAPSEWGPFTANNCLIKIFFRQESSEAEIIGRAYRDHLSPAEVATIKTSGTGECVALLGDEVHHLMIQLTDQESAYFLR